MIITKRMSMPVVSILMCLMVAHAFPAIAAAKLDNKAAESLCYSFLRVVDHYSRWSEFGESDRRRLAKRIRYAVASGTEDHISRNFQQNYSKFGNVFWSWGDKTIPHRADSIRHINPGTASLLILGMTVHLLGNRDTRLPSTSASNPLALALLNKGNGE